MIVGGRGFTACGKINQHSNFGRFLTKNVVHKLLNLRSTKRPNYYFESFFRKLFSRAVKDA